MIRELSDVRDGINICNYDRLDKIDPDAFGAVSLDEAGILKSFGGKVSSALIAAFAHHRFRLCATATPAPNDHMELGQQSDFIGVMPANEMLMRWFINDTAEASQQWRLKKHAEQDFWDWMASWSRMAQNPEDLGFDGSRYVLPPLEIIRHRTSGTTVKPKEGSLFFSDVSATSIFDIKRQTSTERAKLAASIIIESLACGSPNTPPVENPSITPTPQNVSGGNSKGEAKKKTENTCASIMPPIGISLSELPNSSSDTTRLGVSDIQPIQNTANEQRKQSGTPIAEIQTDTKAESSRSPLESPSPNTMLCLNCSEGNAQSAEQPKPADLSTCTLTTATKPERSEVCSVVHAIQVSEPLLTIQNGLRKPQLTSAILRHQSWVLWCDTNDEQAALEAALGNLCISITGSQSADTKDELHEAWLRGERPVLIVKPSMFGHGCNWQHCHNMIFVGRTFSYETWYQAVRRCWRFGQTQSVNVHLIVAEGEDQIGRVIDRKAGDHARMKAAMAVAMKRDTGREAKKISYNPKHQGSLPSWL